MQNPNDWPSTQVTLIGALQQQPSGPAWNTFVDVYGPLIYRFCRRRGLQDADALDSTQNVFMAVRRGIVQFNYDPERGKLRSWLGTIAAREIARLRRASSKSGEPSVNEIDWENYQVETDASWIVEFNSHICDAALNRIQREFEDMTWRAFELLWRQDRKSSEVATLMQKPIDWVYQVKYRVLRRLEKEVRFLTADIPSFSKDLPS